MTMTRLPTAAYEMTSNNGIDEEQKTAPVPLPMHVISCTHTRQEEDVLIAVSRTIDKQIVGMIINSYVVIAIESDINNDCVAILVIRKLARKIRPMHLPTIMKGTL